MLLPIVGGSSECPPHEVVSTMIRPAGVPPLSSKVVVPRDVRMRCGADAPGIALPPS